MADEHPNLRNLLDSLTTINKRLNLIETALSIQAESASTESAKAAALTTPLSARNTGSLARRPLPFLAPSTYTQKSLPQPPPQHSLPSPPAQQSVYPAVYPASPARVAESHSPAPATTPLESPRNVQTWHADNDEDGDDNLRDGTNGHENGNMDGLNRNRNRNALARNLEPVGVDQSRLEALPEGFIVTGRASLQEELDSWTIPRGYSMRINGTRSHGRRQKIRMVCFRGGRSRLRPKEEEAKLERERERRVQFPDLPPRRRKPTTDRISKKCECPFRFELVEVCPGADRYAVHYTNDDHMQHNHAAADLMLDPRARKLPRALKAEVDQWLQGAAAAGGSGSGGGSGDEKGSWTIAKIQAELQRRGYGHVLDFDLRNRKRALLHKERMALSKGGKKADGGDGADGEDDVDEDGDGADADDGAMEGGLIGGSAIGVGDTPTAY